MLSSVQEDLLEHTGPLQEQREGRRDLRGGRCVVSAAHRAIGVARVLVRIGTPSLTKDTLPMHPKVRDGHKGWDDCNRAAGGVAT